MKIKCINNKILSKLEQNMDKKNAEEVYDVEIGKTYTVYTLGVFKDGLCYCICDESFSYYPAWLPSTLFEISDNRLSRCWIFSIYKDDDDKIPFLSFPEWINDPYFYGELIEYNSNDPNAIIFRKYKELMDLEFPNPAISETAQIGDSEWLICPKCIDAWQSKNDIDVLVKCPKCQTIYNNPRYRNEWPHLPDNPIKFKIA